jgi:hypothetical protein
MPCHMIGVARAMAHRNIASGVCTLHEQINGLDKLACRSNRRPQHLTGSTWSRGYGHHRDRDIRHRRAVAGGGLAVVRTMTKKGGASTASCQCGFEGGTRPHADLLTFAL